MSKKIFITDFVDETILNEYSKKFDIIYSPSINYEALKSCINDVYILIISTRLSIKKDLLDLANNLKLIIRMGIGIDHIDLKECEKKDILVCNTPNSNISSVVELIFGQIIRTYRELDFANINTLNKKFRENIELGIELKNKTIGIIGVGRIGSFVAEVAKVFKMTTIGYDPYLSVEEKKIKKIDQWVDRMDVIPELSDIVTIHTPLTEETLYFITDDFLDKMKENSIFINTARGKIVRIDSLIKIAKKGKIRKIIVDVFEDEPFKGDIPLDLQKYFYLSPHMGAYTKESLTNRTKEAFIEMEDFLNNKKPHGLIDFKKGY
ncbi:MAG TPA: NAD(P)-dependent oxidoreductase [Spirochaetota bacterium]|nr:NAD(P)-dependent oxidoreductase [Spirochaetota bacterium]HOL58016.1 NAD(P)-dependent oxidoreductase [Spirochaetota bacterium]HPP05649.1 NAD(P)-dependent oxidoreductase [Spirochaetota bacterium]